MMNLKHFADWLNRIGYVQKNRELFTEEVMTQLLPNSIKAELTVSFTQEIVDKALVHLLKTDNTQPIYTYNDTRIVVEQLKQVYESKFGKKLQNFDEHRFSRYVNSFSGDIIAVKLRYSTVEAWKTEMLQLGMKIAEKVLETPLNAFEVNNRNAFAVFSDQTLHYRPKTPMFVLTALRIAKSMIATMQNSPNNRYTGIMDSLDITVSDLDNNILEMVVQSKGEILEIIVTPVIMYCTTTGEYIHANGRELPENIIQHPIYTGIYKDLLSQFKDSFRSLYTKSIEAIDNELALTDEKDFKRLHRIGALLEELSKRNEDTFVTRKESKVILDIYFKDEHYFLEVTPTYILDLTRKMFLYVRNSQMTQADIEALLQKNLGYYPKLSSVQTTIIYQAFILGYDLRRKVTVK